jgi:hypothetical protein
MMQLRKEKLMKYSNLTFIFRFLVNSIYLGFYLFMNVNTIMETLLIRNWIIKWAFPSIGLLGFWCL